MHTNLRKDKTVNKSVVIVVVIIVVALMDLTACHDPCDICEGNEDCRSACRTAITTMDIPQALTTTPTATPTLTLTPEPITH
jgi:hypothetical protein